MVSLRNLTPTWAARLVAAFDASGMHRVGTPGDLASGAWLAAEATQSGVAIARLPVPIQCTRVEEAYLDCAGLRIDGLPMFDSPACAGVSGTLCASDGPGDIGFAAFPSNAASIKGQPLAQLRRVTTHAALVVATRVTGDSLAPINAQYYTTPFGPPVLQVAGMLPLSRPEALAPGEPFSPQPHPSCSTCPDRALPRHALLRAAAAGRRGGLGTPLAPRATMAAGGGGRRERRGENAV